MCRLGAACVQCRQMGFEGAEVADSGGLEYCCGGGQAGEFGFYKLEVDDLGLCVFGQLVDVVGFIVDRERCHGLFLKMGWGRWGEATAAAAMTCPYQRDFAPVYAALLNI